MDSMALLPWESYEPPRQFQPPCANGPRNPLNPLNPLNHQSNTKSLLNNAVNGIHYSAIIN